MTAQRTEETELPRHCIDHPALDLKVAWGLKLGAGVFCTLIAIFLTLIYQSVSLIPAVKNDVLIQISGIRNEITSLQKDTKFLQTQIDDLKRVRK